MWRYVHVDVVFYKHEKKFDYCCFVADTIILQTSF